MELAGEIEAEDAAAAATATAAAAAAVATVTAAAKDTRSARAFAGQKGGRRLKIKRFGSGITPAPPNYAAWAGLSPSPAHNPPTSPGSDPDQYPDALHGSNPETIGLPPLDPWAQTDTGSAAGRLRMAERSLGMPPLGTPPMPLPPLPLPPLRMQPPGVLPPLLLSMPSLPLSPLAGLPWPQASLLSALQLPQVRVKGTSRGIERENYYGVQWEILMLAFNSS